MSRARRLSKRTALLLAPLAGVALLGAADRPGAVPAETGAVLGAPWLSLEAPANPMDPEVAGAAFVVRAYNHERPLGAALVGRAEGIVDGERRSLELKIRETKRPGTFVVPAEWPAEGEWVVRIGFAGESPATLLVELGSGGGLQAERYYGMQTRAVALGSVRVVQGEPSEGQIDTRLRTLAARSGD